MTENESAKVNISKPVHEKVKNACDGTGYKLQVFYDRALMTYLNDHAADIRTEKEKMHKTRGKVEK